MSIKLTESDWDAMFPDDFIVLGKTKIPIKPVSLSKLPTVIKHFNYLKSKFSEEREFDNFSTPEKIAFIAELIATDGRDLLSELSDLDSEDVVKLPATAALDLAVKCVEVNLQSNTSFLKNLTALVGKMNSFVSSKMIQEITKSVG